MGWKIGDKPLVDVNDADNVLVEQDGKTSRTIWSKVKTYILGTTALTTTDKTVTGAIEEIKENVDLNTTQLSDMEQDISNLDTNKANNTDSSRTTNAKDVTGAINELALLIANQTAQVIIATRDLTIAGTQTISTNANKSIKAILAFGNVHGTKKMSQSVYSVGGSLSCVYVAGDTGVCYTGSDSLIFSDTGATNRTLGDFTNLTKNSFDIGWGIGGTGATGTANLRFLVLYHD